MPRPSQLSDSKYDFRSFGNKPPELEELRLEIEGLHDFLNDKIRTLNKAVTDSITSLSDTVGDNEATAELVYETVATEDFVLARVTETLTASTAFTRAEVTNIRTALATNSFALAQQISSLSASVDGDVDALATATSLLEARVTSAEGTITAQASSITTLNSTVGTLSSTVTTQGSTLVSISGDLTTVEAQWGVWLDINGRVKGRITMDATADSSTIEFLANTISFYDGSGTFKPFEITGSDGEVGLTSTESRFGGGSRHFRFVTGSAGTGFTDLYGTGPGGDYLHFYVVNFGPDHIGQIDLHSSTGALMALTAAALTFGGDTSLYRASANTFKTLDAFQVASMFVDNAAGETVDISAQGAYATIEMVGDTGALIDLRPTAVGDYKMRFIADSSQAAIVTSAGIDLTFTPGGVMKFGTHSALAGETVTGFITIKDSGGTTRKLAVVS
jgi:uncharacterized coiled-coil protein SlyX